MKYSIVYSSTGNTKTLADAIKEELDEKDLIYCGLTDEKALDADIIYIGFWTNQGTCDNLTKEFLSKITNQKVFLFGSAGFGLKEYLEKVMNEVKTLLNKDVQIIDTFMCQGKMKQSVKERYLSMKKPNQDNSKIDMLISNFDEALKHPNEEDIKILKSKIKK